METRRVRLGEHEYEVIPQKIGRLRRRLGSLFNELAAMETDQDVLSLLSTQTYRFLAVFIPDLMPEWEFQGYASERAMEEDDYTDAGDRSPNPEQLQIAVQACLEANKLDVLRHLKSAVGPDFFQAMSRKVVAEIMTRDDLPTSSPASTAGPSTTSSTSDPTAVVPGTETETGDGSSDPAAPAASEESPSLASTAS